MQVGDQVEGGIYAGDHKGHHIICSPIEYDLPFQVNWFQANEFCRCIGMELPTKEELKLLYELYKSTPEYFPKREYHWYWSSTEGLSSTAWFQFFKYVYQDMSKKIFNFYVRPIKRIKI